MARPKKEAALTPEERLQAALVPDWEWPYKLPENWCWTYCKKITSRISDGSHNPPKDAGSGIPLLSATNIHDGIIDFENTSRWITEKEWITENTRTNIEFGDVLLTIVATLGRTAVVETETKFALQRSVAVLKPLIISKFLAFYLDTPYVQSFISDNAKGTAQKGFYLSSVEQLFVPLAPLAEQQRIVDRIESLFSKLDEAKEKAQIMVDSFETRKAAILHKAFSGELTAKWREKHEIGMDSWETKTIEELCFSLKYGTAKKSDASGSVVVIRMGNLQQGEIDWSDLAYSNDSEDIEKYKLAPGDVLFNRTNSAALVGKTSIYRGEYPAIYAGYLIKLDYDHERIIGDFLNYALNTPEAKEYCNSVKTDGVNQSNINAKKIGAYSFMVPKVEEQRKVVEEVQQLLSKEQQAKEAAEAVLDQIDLMKKSILARAFRGELGTNDPTDEPAVELIKSILQQKIEQGNKPKKQEKKGNHKEENIVAKTILEVLTVQKRATPEALKKGTELDIDDFYDQVKALIASKAITETREGNEVFLEVTHADRQVNN